MVRTLIRIGLHVHALIAKRRPKLYELGGAAAGGTACYRAWGITGLVTFVAVVFFVKSAEDDD